MTDLELLRMYVGGGGGGAADAGEGAFGELVKRHMGWVYASCLRQVRDPGLAEDVAQAVFITLARKAAVVAGGEERSITGWLFSTARFAAASAMKVEGRRRRHERQAAAMNSDSARAERMWEEIEPLVDGAIAGLGRADRDVLVLRFFRNMTHEAIAQALHVSEAAAQKRVSRAVERLRKRVAPTLSAGALGGILVEHLGGAAPTHFAAGVGAALRVGASPRTKMILQGMGAMKKVFVAKVVAVLGVACAVTVTAFAWRGVRGGPSAERTVPATAAAVHTTGAYDLAAIHSFRATSTQGGLTWTATYSREQGVLVQLAAAGWSANHLFRGEAEWDFAPGGAIVFKKRPVSDADAQLLKLEMDLTGLQKANATRVAGEDATVGGIRCEAYEVKDPSNAKKRTVVYIDPATKRPARIKSDDPAMDLTLAYDQPVAEGLFSLPAGTNVRTVDVRTYLTEKYPLGSAVYTHEEIGQIFAVHEVSRDAAGGFEIVCSCRVAPVAADATSTLADDVELDKFMMDDNAELPFRYVRVAEFAESGIRVMYVVAIPRGQEAGDTCDLPVTMASAAEVMGVPGVSRPNDGGKDVHFVASVKAGAVAGGQTVRQFGGRAYDEFAVLLPAIPSGYMIGPGTDAGLSSKEACLDALEKAVAP